MNRIVLVRHGENPANISKEFSSRKVDYSLTPKGILQAQQTATWLESRCIDGVFSSPLKRARETAEIIGARIGLEVQIEDGLREVDVGELEGRPVSQEDWQFYLDTLRGWVDGRKEIGFPGGENFYQLWARFNTSLERMTGRREGQRLVVVGHGGLFSVSLAALCPGVDLGALLEREIHNCAIGEIDLIRSGGSWQGRVVRWAYDRHLSGEAAQLVSGILRPAA